MEFRPSGVSLAFVPSGEHTQSVFVGVCGHLIFAIMADGQKSQL